MVPPVVIGLPARKRGPRRSSSEWRGASIVLLLCGFAVGSPAPAQSLARVSTPGPGAPGVLLQRALAAPYALRVLRGGSTALPRDTTFDRTVLVVGGDATVASTVRGDVIVVGGNLFLHPGARVDGRAVAIGGGVYNSTLAVVTGGLWSYPDVAYRVGGDSTAVVLAYASGPEPPPVVSFSLPGFRGVRVPGYSRVDGLVLSAGPRVTIAGGGGVLDPLLTYRSDLGALDLSVGARALIPGRFSVEAFAGRATFTNDAWIQGDLANSLSVLTRGRDYRNYWRSDRVQAMLLRDVGPEAAPVTVGAGVRTERDWSVAAGAPWSLTGRTSPRGILRPNPGIAPGRLSSGLVHVRATPTLGDVQFNLTAVAEAPWQTPDDSRWLQTTLDATVSFPTFGLQRLAVRARAVATAGDDAPPQRASYLGGLGTLVTLPPLAMGGDEMIFASARYDVPVTRFAVPYLGAPVISLVSRLGAAGVHRLPRLEQELGVRLTLGVVHAEVAVNPATRKGAFVASVLLTP